jgi:hypothetical protein
MENENQNENPLEMTERIKGYLSETARWGKFIAIVSYIGVGIMALFGLILLFVGIPAQSFGNGAFSGVPGGIMGFIYLVMAVVYYFPTSFLYKYAARIKSALLDPDQDEWTSGFHNLSKLFTFIGIMTVIVLALYALMLLILVPMFLFVQHRAF